MKIINCAKDLNNALNADIFLTIGNFDGLHKGHKDLIGNILKSAKTENAKLLVVSFKPHPSVILRNENNFLINCYEDKVELLESFGVDFFFEIPFTRDFSTQTGEEFLNTYIGVVKNLKRVYLGHDFAFGANKKGGFELMESYFSNTDVQVIPSREFKENNKLISSTEIRKKLSEGNIREANSMLGREFYLSGPVIKGMMRGRQIGFPTANIKIDEDRIIPQKGVYKTKVEFQGAVYKSVTNIGHNPTFADEHPLSVETHILDFDQDIYGENLKVFFCDKYRNEMKFNTVNDLIKQIKTDVEKRKKD